jgi:hypothetical protein
MNTRGRLFKRDRGIATDREWTKQECSLLGGIIGGSGWTELKPYGRKRVNLLR